MSLSTISGLGNNFSSLNDLNSIKNSEANESSFTQVFQSALENKDEEGLKEACVEFESYFLSMMFKSMRKTIIPAEEKSNAEQIFQDMLDQQMCQDIARTSGVGLGDMMYKQLSKEI